MACHHTLSPCHHHHQHRFFIPHPSFPFLSLTPHSSPPSNCFCPSSWNWHTKAEGCVPPVENHNCDCGDGFSWDSGSHQCQPQQSCSGNKWWSAIVGKCCTTNPPAGTCPPGKSCPDNWSWSTSYQHCVPNKPQCPPPQCPTGTTWNPTTKCCGGSTPSSGTGGGSGHGSGGGWGGWRKHKRSDGDFEQSAFDSAYCPDGKVCTVPSPNGSAWSWECINPLTELESCGGCLADGEGVDCTSISHASSVGCVQGKCEVYTCKKGFTPSGDKCAAN